MQHVYDGFGYLYLDFELLDNGWYSHPISCCNREFLLRWEIFLQIFCINSSIWCRIEKPVETSKQLCFKIGSLNIIFFSLDLNFFIQFLLFHFTIVRRCWIEPRFCTWTCTWHYSPEYKKHKTYTNLIF